jgi:FkbM family methyltransferase
MDICTFHNKHKNTPVFMIGNGPSLSETPLDELRGMYSFAMNRIALIYGKVRWRPSFFICTSTNIAREEWRRDIIKTITLGTPSFIWDKLKQYVEPYHFKNVAYVNCTHGKEVTDSAPDDWWSYDASQRVCKFGTSMLPALQIAIYMGFNPIYLLGCDLGFKPPIQAVDNRKSSYDAGRQVQKDPNHFAADYGTPGCPPDVLNTNMRAAHILARRAAERIGVAIYNATPGGDLDVYPRVDLRELLSPKSSASKKVVVNTAEISIGSDVSSKPSDEAGVKINLIDIGSAGGLPQPWASHQQKIGKQLTFEPRKAATVSDDVISMSACLWERAEDRNFYIYRGFNGTGSSLLMQNYDYVLQNFESLRQRGPKELSETWLERSLPVDIERVHCRTLDDILNELNLSYPFHFLKIDAQGAEYQILKGGEKYLRNDCYGLQLELFVLPLYKGIKLLDEVASHLDGLGFEMVKKYPLEGSFDSQHECIFLRRGITDEVMRTIRRIYGLPALPSATVPHGSDAPSVSRTLPSATGSESRSGGISCLQQTIEAKDKANIASPVPTGSGFQRPIPEQVLARSREQLTEFHNRHRGQRCVIIGNGPSLNTMDLSFLKNEITFGMNRIYLLFDKWDFRPTYYVSVNPLVIEQSADQIHRITSPKFLGLNGLPYIQNHRDNIFLQSIRRPSFSTDPRNGLWEGHTVTYVAMQLAYFMGFSEVILIGVDHYFRTKGIPNKEIVSQGTDENHFHPDYFGKGVRWNLPDLEKSEMAYKLAKQAFKANGRRIIDATVDGRLAIFPKADYREIFLPAAHPVKNVKAGLSAELVDTEFEEYFRNKSESIEPVTVTTSPKFGPTDSAEQHQRYLVSAIVSTYNSERFLRGCLEDLENQTIADRLEIIVVNSGSQQNEEAIVKEFQQKYDNIVYIKTDEREGIYTAWNRAVRAARGEFITNANTDDRHRADALEIMAKTLQENPDAALVYGDQICTDTPNGTFAGHHATEMAKRPDYSRQRLLFGCCVGSQPTWRKSLHSEFGCFDETLSSAGDWDFWLRISSKYKFKHIPEFLGLYYYNKHGIEHGRKIHSLYERYIVGRRYGNPYISVIPLYHSKDNPLVSVIMPAYNAAEYIAEAIESVLIQNYRNFELIIVDDGSTDNTKDIITGFKDDKIKYFYKQNAGPSSARNLAIKRSKGQYIMPLDSDDMMTPDFIARHLQEFEKHPEADLVYSDVLLIDVGSNPIRVMKKPEYQDRRHMIRDLLRAGHPIIPFRLGIRKNVFDKIGFYDEKLMVAEDYDMMRRFVKHGLKVHHLPGALHMRRMTASSLSRNSTLEHAKFHFDVVKRFMDTFRYDELFPDVAWERIPAEHRQSHAKCLAAVTFLGVGQAYVKTNSVNYARTAFDLACSELNSCLQTDPGNVRVRQLLEKSELARSKCSESVPQAAC